MLRFFIFLALTSCICAKAQVYYVNEPFLKAYSHVLNFEKNKALEIIHEQTKGKTSVNLLLYYVETSAYFIEAFLTETREDKIKWDSKFSFWEKKFMTGQKSSPYYNYCIAHLYMQKGLLHLKFQEFVQAGFELRKASRMLEKNYQKFPDFIVQYKEYGFLQCFLGNLPEQYEWLLGLAGLSGNLKLGESLLQKILKFSMEKKEYSFLQLETLLYYTTVMTVLYNDADIVKKVLPYFLQADQSFHKSPLYIYMLSNVYSHIGNNDKAFEELERYHPSSSSIRFDYLTYLKGVLMLHQAKPHARQYFFKFVSDFKGMHYVKSAYQKIAWTYLLEGDMKQYELYMSITFNSGYSVNDADKQAMHEAKNRKTPHATLLKSRLLCDGGYYEQALDVMNSIDSSEIFKNKKYYTEFHYRYARIYHLSNQISRAIDAYKKVIEMGQNDVEYFAANSALMLGMIYEENKDFSNARHYYRLCLNMPFEEYRNSIQQKAKAGLQRVGR